MRAAKWITLGFALLGAGCFTVEPRSGTIHCSSNQAQLCPKNFSCVNDYCVTIAILDGGTVDDGFLNISTD